MNNNVKEFLKELTKLSKKHGISISGCGCCGSPFLIEREVGDKERYVVDRELERLQLETK